MAVDKTMCGARSRHRGPLVLGGGLFLGVELCWRSLSVRESSIVRVSPENSASRAINKRCSGDIAVEGNYPTLTGTGYTGNCRGDVVYVETTRANSSRG